MPDTSTFANPPIVELVLIAQFSPLTKLTTAHLGWFWKELGDDWCKPSDGPLIQDQYELFDPVTQFNPPQMKFELHAGGFPSRLMIEHREKDRLLQIQNSRFQFHWRKSGGFYPSFKKLIAEFENMYVRFSKFIVGQKLGTILPNQWELTYIDAFPQGDAWQTPSNWSAVLPGLFGPALEVSDANLDLEQRTSRCVFRLPSKQGRLHVAAHSGRWVGDAKVSLLLQMTARGPIGKNGVSTLREGLDLGHNATSAMFLKVVDPRIQAGWGIES